MPYKNRKDATAYQRKWQTSPRGKAVRKAFRDRHPEKIRHQKRIQRAGVIPNRPCPEFCEAGCGRRAETLDHDHALGIFRGWLCHQCNRSLGMLMDSPLLLRALAAYLERAWFKP